MNIFLKNDSTYPIHPAPCTTTEDRLIGSIYISFGFMYQLFYIPCLIVIGREKQRRHSCFKIMLYLGVVDNLCLLFNSILCGYFSFFGMTFCSHPKLFYITGCVALSLWCNNCATCVLLGANRCVDLWKWDPLVKIFEGNRTWMVLSGAFVYSLFFFFFTNPLVYSSKYHTFFFNPLMDAGATNHADFANVPHTLNNFATVIILSVLYSALCMKIVLRSNKAAFPSSRIVGRMQKQIFFQSFVICIINMSAAVIYVYMQDTVMDKTVYIFAQFAWQASHGSISVVYLTMNRTIRRGVYRMFMTCFGTKSNPNNNRIRVRKGSRKSETTPLDAMVPLTSVKTS